MSESATSSPRTTAGILFGPRYIAAAAVGTAVAALALGIPTDVVPNPWFIRMMPAEGLNYFFWVSTSLVTGLLLATYVLPELRERGGAGAGIGGGLLGLLAVGCPVCNKVVIALLGVSGALTYFAPIQPFLGAAGLVLASAALVLRVKALDGACRLTTPGGAGRAG